MNIKAFECTTCGDTIYCRCESDDRAICQCGRVKVEQGYVNPIVLINNEQLLCPNLIDITVNVEPDILYWDWNLMLDEYGYISELPSLKQNNELNRFTNEHECLT